MDAITTQRLLLEPWDEKRREEWVSLAADPRVTRWIGTGNPWDRRRSEQTFDSMLEHRREHGFGWRSVIDRESGDWLGFVGLNYVGVNPAGLQKKDVEIGWWLKPEGWGKGLATEGATAARDEGFERLALDRIVARHHAGNPSSGRIMEKIGMTFVREAIGADGVPLRIFDLDRDRWFALTDH